MADISEARILKFTLLYKIRAINLKLSAKVAVPAIVE